VDSTAVASVVIVVGSASVAIAGLFATLRWLPHLVTSDDEGTKGVFFNMVGVLYAVLLAFVVVIVWGDFVDAGQTSEVEVTRLSNLARDAAGFPDETRDELRDRIVTYAEAVAGPEWDSMAEGEPSPVAARAYEAIWAEYYALEPRGPREEAFYGESITRLNELGENRRIRLLTSTATVPTPMWLLLLGGFVITVGWTYLFKTGTVATHVIAVGSIAALTGFVLFLIYALQHPFAGSVQISPDPFLDIARQYSGRT
jgi:hypothetical protein